MHKHIVIRISFRNPLWYLLHWREIREERASARRVAAFKAALMAGDPNEFAVEPRRYEPEAPRPNTPLPPRGWGGAAQGARRKRNIERLHVEPERVIRVGG